MEIEKGVFIWQIFCKHALPVLFSFTMHEGLLGIPFLLSNSKEMVLEENVLSLKQCLLGNFMVALTAATQFSFAT